MKIENKRPGERQGVSPPSSAQDSVGSRPTARQTTNHSVF
jgi:hypothetical protein